mmetsp:Transcript_821/g.1134  ORF Transcript_821/g.1134 Transcript_821/m.1134 type:complete len:80 (+) Transcript_821:945-1184(+)
MLCWLCWKNATSSDLLKLKFEDILNYFKVLLIPFKVNVDALFEKAFSVPLKKRHHIEKYANEWILQLLILEGMSSFYIF